MQPTSKPPPSKPTEQVPLEDCLRILLRGIQNNAVIADGSDGQEFQAALATLEGQLQGEENAGHWVDSAVEILNRYGTQANQAIACQKSALAVAMDHWNAVEEQIKAISIADDLPAVKARLSSQIALARAEVLEAAGNADSPAAGHASKTLRSAAAIYKADQLTGLPARASAEVELARAHAQSPDCYLALFVVKRLGLINAKFGYSRGDQVLLKVVIHLAQSLPDFDKLFRWTPCAFLTLAPPETSYKELRAKVQMIELARLSPTLEWEGRSAMVPVVIDCRIIRVKDFETPSDLFLRLDTLAADA
ncbi:MAG: GGDEF domain-containing protein [Bryobacteraceae bacterium]|jgi:GGDEF domain-containing protein